MKRYTFLLVFMLMFGCGTRKIAVSKLQQLHRKGYEIKLNGNTINPALYFLDRDNLVRVKRANKTIELQQKDPRSEVADLQVWIDRFKDQRKSDQLMVVIDGIPIDSAMQRVKIERSAVKSVNYLGYDQIASAISCRQVDVLLISTKQ